MENVKQDASIGTNILRVSASDEDADNNGAITYSLSAPSSELSALEYFEIQPESGWIVLKKPLDVSVPTLRLSQTFYSRLVVAIKSFGLSKARRRCRRIDPHIAKRCTCRASTGYNRPIITNATDQIITMLRYIRFAYVPMLRHPTHMDTLLLVQMGDSWYRITEGMKNSQVVPL